MRLLCFFIHRIFWVLFCKEVIDELIFFVFKSITRSVFRVNLSFFFILHLLSLKDISFKIFSFKLSPCLRIFADSFKCKTNLCLIKRSILTHSIYTNYKLSDFSWEGRLFNNFPFSFLRFKSVSIFLFLSFNFFLLSLPLFHFDQLILFLFFVAQIFFICSLKCCFKLAAIILKFYS